MTTVRRPRNKVLLVDDHPITRLGLATLINRQPTTVVCGETQTPATVLSQVIQLRPDLVVMDIALGSGNGLELIRNLKAHRPQLPVLVISDQEELVNAELAMDAGADGYVMKNRPLETLVAALHLVLQGKVYLSEEMTARILKRQLQPRPTRASSLDALSPRERQVFQRLGHWQRTRDIARQLGISVKTVEYFRHCIKEKLGLKDSTELVRFATERMRQYPSDDVPSRPEPESEAHKGPGKAVEDTPSIPRRAAPEAARP